METKKREQYYILIRSVIVIILVGISKKQDKTSKIKIRILSDKKLPPFFETAEAENVETIENGESKFYPRKIPIVNKRPKEQHNDSGFFNFAKIIGCLGREPGLEIDPYFDGIVIHFHGGGFVAMSSGSHQCYTRQ